MNIATRNKIHDRINKIEDLCSEVSEAVQEAKVEEDPAGHILQSLEDLEKWKAKIEHLVQSIERGFQSPSGELHGLQRLIVNGDHRETAEHEKKIELYQQATRTLLREQIDSLRHEMRAGLEAADTRLQELSVELKLANSRLFALVDMQDPRKHPPIRHSRKSSPKSRRNRKVKT